MARTPGGQGGFQQNQHNFAYNDGNTSFQYQSQHSNWTSTSQQAAPAPMLPQPQFLQQPPPMPPLLPGLDVHQQHMQMALQIHAQGLQHHNAVLQSMQQGMQRQSPFQPMLPMLPAPPLVQLPQQIQYTPSPERVQYAQSPAPTQYQQTHNMAPRSQHYQPLPTIAPPQGHANESDSCGSDDSEDECKQEIGKTKRRLADGSPVSERAAQEKIHKVEVQLQQLYDTQTNKDRRDRETANRKAAALAQQLARVTLEKAEVEERYRRDLAEAHASKPQAPGTPLDMSAVRGAIREAIHEVKTNSLSKADISSIVRDTLGQITTGLATTEDMKYATVLLQNELNKLPSALSDAQIDSAVQRGFDNAVHKYVQPRSKQQRLESPQHQSAQPWQQEQPSRVQTTFDITELPGDDEGRQYALHGMQAEYRKALPARNYQSQQHSQIQNTSDIASSMSSKSSASVYPSPDNAVMRFKHSGGPSPSGPAYQREMRLSEDALARLTVPQDSSSKPKSSYSKSKVSVQPSADNALTLIKPTPVPSNNAAKSSYSKSRVSIQPSDDNALERIKRSDQAPIMHSSQPLEIALTNATLARAQHSDTKDVKSSRKSTISVQPSANNIIAKPTSDTPSPFRSSAQAIAAAQAQGGQLANHIYGGHAGIHPELPDEFPDTASQITSWERNGQPKRAISGEAMVDRNTVARRPRNDHREDDARSRASGLREVVSPDTERRTDRQALVRQREKSDKKSRR